MCIRDRLENMIKPQLKYQIEQILELQLTEEITRLEQEKDKFTEEYQKNEETKKTINDELLITEDFNKKKTLTNKIIKIEKRNLELTTNKNEIKLFNKTIKRQTTRIKQIRTISCYIGR